MKVVANYSLEANPQWGVMSVMIRPECTINKRVIAGQTAMRWSSSVHNGTRDNCADSINSWRAAGSS